MSKRENLKQALSGIPGFLSKFAVDLEQGLL